MVKINNNIVHALMETHGAQLHATNATHTFYKKGHIIICIPLGEEIALAHLQAIAREQLGVTLPTEKFAPQKRASTEAIIKKLI